MMDIDLTKKIVGHAERDAIHVAVVPLIVGEKYMRAGQLFRLRHNTHIALSAHTEEDAVGVISPFLTEFIKEGDQVWGLLWPNSVTGMRHHWFHPMFDEAQPAQSESEQWLRDFADSWNFDFGELIENASNVDSDWRYVTARGIDLHSKEELDEDYYLFWHHLEKFTGKKFSDEDKENMGWSCSC